MVILQRNATSRRVDIGAGSRQDALAVAHALEDFKVARSRAQNTAVESPMFIAVRDRMMAFIKRCLSDVHAQHSADGVVLTRVAEPEPFVGAPPDAEQLHKAVVDNEAYRRVLFTAADRSLQLVAMSVRTTIPAEVHDDVHQYFLVKDGAGVLVVDDQPTQISVCSAQWVMRGQKHEVRADPDSVLKLFVTYVGAHHPRGHVDWYNVDVLK